MRLIVTLLFMVLAVGPALAQSAPQPMTASQLALRIGQEAAMMSGQIDALESALQKERAHSADLARQLEAAKKPPAHK